MPNTNYAEVETRHKRNRKVALGMGAWLGVYAGALLIVSLSSREWTLGLALESALDRGVPFEQPVGPAGFYTKDIVFDLPSDIQNPRLLVTQGIWVERLIEFFLIGDEDSLFHRRTMFRLEPQP